MMLSYHFLGAIRQIEEIRHALFVGFFGPIGVSAIFYLFISREFLLRSHESERADLQVVAEAIEIVVWFLVMCSIVVHGLSIPLGKLGFYIPRTLGTAMSTERISASQSRARSESREDFRGRAVQNADGSRPSATEGRPSTRDSDPPLAMPKPIAWMGRSFVRAGKHIYNDIKRPHGTTVHGEDEGVRKKEDSDSSANSGAHPEISMPTNARPIGSVVSDIPLQVRVDGADERRAEECQAQGKSPAPSEIGSGANTPNGGRPARRIQFADESLAARTPQANSPNDGSPIEEKSEPIANVNG